MGTVSWLKIYNFQFWLMCLGSFLFFASFNMIIPELPEYLSSLGGADYKGLIIALFTLTAGLSRPFSGKLTDKIGRIPIMVFGSAVCLVSGLLYPVLGTIAGFLILRLFHGLSTGFKPTATSAYIADVAPSDRRGEAMGILGFFSSIGMASGPVLGSYLALHYSLNTMFYASSILALASVFVLIGMKESLKTRESFKFRLLKIKKEDILEPKVYSPSFVLMLNVFAFGVILTIIPDFSIHLGLKNKGVFFAIFTITSLMVRIFAGQASDRYGRIPLLKIASVTIFISLILIGLSTKLYLFYIASGLYGIGVGIGTPTAYAWTIDLSEDLHRGRALATMFIALEVGIGAGALLSGWIYDNNPNNFSITFMISAGMSALALIYLFLYSVKKKKLSDVKVWVSDDSLK